LLPTGIGSISLRCGPAAARFGCSAVSLEDGPPDLLQRKTHFKLFFEAPPDSSAPESEEEGNARYAELFFNIAS